MSQDPFKKFKVKKKNSVVKEKFKQEKKVARKEKNAYFDNLKKEKYEARMAKKTGLTPKAVVSTNTDTAKKIKKAIPEKTTDEVMPLNKFLAHCGISSRRDAVEIISKGGIKVNNEIATEPGYKVQPTDEIFYNGKRLYVTKNLVYILLNKPKDFITTTDDPQGRKTVSQLIQHATTERVYPIGRLDRNTSGVLLFTNDGDLTQKLSHPSYEIKKIYEVKLDKLLTKAHFDAIITGLTLEDGAVFVDSLAYADSKDKSIIGIEIHSGRNRIVRRIFESLGYDVKALDRVMYAGLTKKNVERGKWRFLSEKEIRVLKYLNASKLKKNAEKEKVSNTTSETELQDPSLKAKPIEKKNSLKVNKQKIPIEKVKKEEREKLPAKPRKFKTHSEKKAHKLITGGKK